jgi:polysaccharide pyruvyl transferase WcaK-like protein
VSARIVICAEVWSENLGDRVIAECMQGVVQEVAPQSQVSLLDLSARRQPASAGRADIPARDSQWRRFYRIVAANRPIRRVLTLASWWTRRGPIAARQARQAMASADLLIVGGGQLLADNELAFPLRLAQLTKIAAQARVPIVVLCCGVGQRWSRIGSRLMTRALARAQLVCVRDVESKRRLETLGLARGRIDVAPDPAILAARYFQLPARRSESPIGLGVMAPQVVARHAATQGRDAASLLQFWTGLARALLERGSSVEIFTNGAAEDAEFAARVAHAVHESLGRSVAIRTPVSAPEFVTLIAGYSGLVAYRLHACIVGVACGVPTLGLIWDDKVRAFFEEVGLPQNALPPSQQSWEIVAQRAQQVASLSAACAARADEQLRSVVRAALQVAP